MAVNPENMQRLGLETEPGVDYSPENFRGEESGYFPNRIVEATPRALKLIDTINQSISDQPIEMQPKLRKRLFDLLVFNAYGRIYALPNNAGDFIGVADAETNPQFENCIALVKIKNNLALSGGFNDAGEAMTQTVAREGFEETNAAASDIVAFHQASYLNRDNRFAVISTCAAGVLEDIDALQAQDDAGSLVIVPLITAEGDFNDTIFEPGSYTDALGKQFSHEGLRADHGEILRQLYFFWKDHKIGDESLDQLLHRMSDLMPQEWFERFAQHPAGSDMYEKLEIPDKKPLLATPNIRFTLAKAEQIFQDVGINEASTSAKQLISELVEADLLPLFPQAATTVDCVLCTQDSLYVQIDDTGAMSLPGSFYSPETNAAYKHQAEAGEMHTIPSLPAFAQALVQDKLGVDFRPTAYLGTVGGNVALGKQADDRYPRLSYVMAGVVTAAYKPKGNIVAIPIWADKEKGILSEAIVNGQWKYSHNREILAPLLFRLLRTLDPQCKLTAEEVLRRQRLTY